MNRTNEKVSRFLLDCVDWLADLGGKYMDIWPIVRRAGITQKEVRAVIDWLKDERDWGNAYLLETTFNEWLDKTNLPMPKGE